MKRPIASMIVVALVACGSAAAATAQESLGTARELYAAAAYEDALASLDRLRPASRSTDEARAIEQYRAFCLLALGRTGEAEQAIGAVVTADPLYRPTEADLSPRLSTAFTGVRRRILPELIARRYADAKAAYDRKDFAPAAAGFAQVLAILHDPDVATASHEAPLADILTLATGFRELSAKAAAPPPPPPPPPAPAPAPAPPPVPSANRIYTLDDPDVVAPTPLHQTLPPFRGKIMAAAVGVIEVVLDETGTVMSAIMRVPVSPDYDAQAVRAARAWRYRPATVRGTPVKFRRLVQVTLKPTE